MKEGVKDVIHEGCCVTVIYDDDSTSVQNFSTPGSALDYCASFGGPAPQPVKKVAAKKPAAKAPAKKPVVKSKSTKKS